MKRDYNGIYENKNLSYINFPLGGIGAGNYCVSGTGALKSFSLRNSPNIFNNPNIFAAVTVKSEKSGYKSRILEGQVPTHEIFSSHGSSGPNYGLPRFKSNDFISAE